MMAVRREESKSQAVSEREAARPRPHPASGPTPQAGFPPLPEGEGIVFSFSRWEKVPRSGG